MSSSSFREAIAEALDELDIIETKPKRKNHRGGKRTHQKKAAKAQAAQDALTAGMICFEQTEDRGIGTFATTDITKGTRILSESPLIELPPPGMGKPKWSQDVTERYKALSEDKQNTFLTLYCRMEQPLLRQLALEAIQSGEVRAEDIKISDLADIQDFPDGPLKQKIRVAGTFQVNAFGIYGEGPHSAHVAVFQYASRINHSCAPNTWHSWNDKTKKHNVHAIRDIALGEEITTEYVDSLDVKEHRKSNLQLYGIDCRCEACVDDEAEARRAEIQYLEMEEFGQFKQQLDAGGRLSHEDIRQALAIAEKLLALFDDEGTVGIHQEEMQVFFSSLLHISLCVSRFRFYQTELRPRGIIKVRKYDSNRVTTSASGSGRFSANGEDGQTRVTRRFLLALPLHYTALFNSARHSFGDTIQWGKKWIEALRCCVGDDHPSYEHAVEEVAQLRTMSSTGL